MSDEKRTSEDHAIAHLIDEVIDGADRVRRAAALQLLMRRLVTGAALDDFAIEAAKQALRALATGYAVAAGSELPNLPTPARKPAAGWSSREIRGDEGARYDLVLQVIASLHPRP